MGLKKFMIHALKNHFYGMCKVNDLVDYCNSQGYTCNRKTALINIRQTYKILKPNRKKDIIQYVENPSLPENFSDIMIYNTPPENIEEILFKFIFDNKYIPSMQVFKEYCRINYKHNYLTFNWAGKNNFYVTKNHVIEMLEETKNTHIYKGD